MNNIVASSVTMGLWAFYRRFGCGRRREFKNPGQCLWAGRYNLAIMSGGPLITLYEGLVNGYPDQVISSLLVLVLLLLISFPVHEFAHAFAATQLGDDTPRLMGRLTLNPLAHLDPWGALLFSLFGFGWAKPVPFRPYRLNGDPRISSAIVALAGPVSNLILAGIFAILYRLSADAFSGSQSTVLLILVRTFQYAVFLNVLLAVFNLVPIPPLDGFRILEAFLPAAASGILAQLNQFGWMLLFIISATGIFGRIIGPPVTAISRLLLGA